MGLLTRDTRRQLIEALTAIPVLDSSAGRGLLLHDLPPRLTPMIARSEAKLLDLNAIVDACDHWEPIPGVPHPLRLLIENARDLVTGSAVATRLQAYREQTAPVLAWYEARNGVHRIPAVGTIEEIAGRVRKALGR